VRIDPRIVSVGVTAVWLVAACSRVHEPKAAVVTAEAKAASSTTFDWAPPCRVPVQELRSEDDETRKIRYVLELTRGPGDRLELRQRDFVLLELNGEDMTTPEHAAQGPGLLVLDQMVPPLYLNAAGEVIGTGPPEGELAKQLGGSPGVPELEDRAAEQWRTWVGAWTGWSVAPGQTKDAAVEVETKATGKLAASDHAEHLGADGGQVKLRVTRTLGSEAVQRKYARLIMSGKEFQAQLGNDDRFVQGHERTVYSVETDAATLRPAHARYESENLLEMSESGGATLRRVRDTTFDWAHAEGCKR
jgi:hypothetical protein